MKRHTRRNPVATAADVFPAIRKGDPWWDEVFAPPTDTPDITVASASQISGGTTFLPSPDYNYDPYFRYDGCHAVVASTPGVQVVTPPEVVIPETVTDAQDIEFKFRAGRTGSGVIGVRVVVDGKLSSVAMQRTTGTSGTVYFYKVHFAAAKMRHLKFEIDGANRFDGVVVGAHTVLQRPRGPHALRHTAIGDSLTIGGANYHPGAEESTDRFYFRFESHAYYQSVLMGCDSFISLGAGGTGWSDNIPADPFANRVPVALAGNPHVLGFYGSRNDWGKEAQVLAAVQDAISQVERVPVVLVCGPQQAGYTALNELVRQGVLAAGRTWLNLDGVAASPASNVTGHPTLLEQQSLAKAAHAQIDMVGLTTVVEAANAARQPALVALTSSPGNTVAAAASVTITARVSTPLAAPGRVRFYDNGVVLGTDMPMENTLAAMSTSALTVGTHKITARFLPEDPQVVKTVLSEPMTLTVSDNLGMTDTFNRDDGPVGNTENGKPWVVGGYTGWVIAGNALANPTALAGGSFIWCDCGTPVGTYKWVMAGSYSALPRLLLFFAAGDVSNYVFLNCGGGGNNWRLYTRISNVANTIATGLSDGGWAAGDEITVDVTQGSTATRFNFVVKKNNVAIPGLTVANYDIGATVAAKTGIGAMVDSASTGSKFDEIEMIAEDSVPVETSSSSFVFTPGRTVQHVTGSVTVGSLGDYLVLIDPDGAVTMPSAVGNTGMYILKNRSGESTNILTTAGQTIQGATPYTLIDGESITIVSAGTGWEIV